MLFGKTSNKKFFFNILTTSSKKNLFSVLVIVIISIWSLLPIIKNFGKSVVDGADDLLIVWIMNQTINKVPYGLNNIFQGNIFYPYKNTMAYSEMFVPSALVSYFPVKLTSLPLIAYDFNLFLGQILTILVIYFWFRDITRNEFSSLLAALAIGLSVLRFHYLVHIQMWSMQWWLMASWLIWRYKKFKKVKYLYFAGILIIIQAWESILPLYFILLIGLILLYPYIKYFKRDWKHFIVIILIISLSVLPLFVAYYSVSSEFNYVRPIREVAHFSMSIDEIWGRFLSPGLYGLLLVSLVMIRKINLIKNKEYRFFIILLIIGLVLSFGPVLKWDGKTIKFFDNFFIPSPYGILYYIIPGFKALRTPVRWYWVSCFAGSGIIALSFSLFKSKFRHFLLFLGMLVAIIGGTKLNNVVVIPTPNEYPLVYKWLKNQPGNVILELPIYSWGAGRIFQNEYLRMLYSLEHKKNLINGASGFNPPLWENLVAELNSNFPDVESENKLTNLNVDYLIVHKDEYNIDKLTKIYTWGKNRLIWQDQNTYVFKL